MKIFIEKGEKKDAFRDLIPRRFLFQQVLLLGCEEDGELIGAAVLEKTGADMHLLWLWVKQDFRRRGAGTQLLDFVMNAAKKLGAETLVTEYSSAGQCSRILNYMLAGRQFELTEESVPAVRVTRSELEESVLLTMKLPEAKEGVCVKPLKYLTSRQLQKMIQMYESREAYIISRADFMNADRNQSMVLLRGEAIGGMTLVQHMPEEGHFLLDLFFLEKRFGTEGTRLLRETAKALMPPVINFKSLEFSCVNKQALTLAEKLLGEKSIRQDVMTQAVLWL